VTTNLLEPAHLDLVPSIPSEVIRMQQQVPTMILDPAPLSEAYVPRKLPGLDAQLQRMLACLAPALKRRKALHMWLHGPPGSGKTAAAAHILHQVEQKAGIRGLLVNCWQKDTFFELIDDIIYQLRILRAEEHRTSTKLEKLARHIGQRPFVIALDEIDKMRSLERSAALYGLSSIGNVCLVCISCSLGAWFELEERVRSRLSPCFVRFPAYSSGTLADILDFRSRTALAEGSYSENLLEQIAGMASGDARVALHSMQVLAESAEDAHLRAISAASLMRQQTELEAARQETALATLTEDHRILYGLIRRKGEILSGELWEGYLQRCAEARRRPLAARTFSEYANALVRTGLITAERARVKGKVRLFRASI